MEAEGGSVAVSDRLRTDASAGSLSSLGPPDATSSPLRTVEPSLSRPVHAWIVSRPVDLLFFCNLPWLLAFLPLVFDSEGLPRVEFWQIYFLTTPHRWLTLVLVATDPDRRGQRTRLFVAIAAGFFMFVIGVRWFTGAFTCLALIDYVWNAWHFGSQHAGILRIYSRRAGGARVRGETWPIRALVVYTSLRLLGSLTGWTENSTEATAVLSVLDHAMLLLPAWLLIEEAVHFTMSRVGACCYAASVSLLYSCLLWSVAHQVSVLVLSLTVAASAFHAVEYMALVSFYAGQRRTAGSASLFRTFAQQWSLLLVIYIVAIGFVGYGASKGKVEWWIGANLWVAFLHYAYDGMIWKLRRPATAKLLGAESTSA